MNALLSIVGGLLLMGAGFWFGFRVGALAERQRLARALRAAKGHLLEAMERFAKSFPQDVTVQVIDKDGTIIAEGSTRPDKGERIH